MALLLSCVGPRPENPASSPESRSWIWLLWWLLFPLVAVALRPWADSFRLSGISAVDYVLLSSSDCREAPLLVPLPGNPAPSHFDFAFRFTSPALRRFLSTWIFNGVLSVRTRNLLKKFSFGFILGFPPLSRAVFFRAWASDYLAVSHSVVMRHLENDKLFGSADHEKKDIYEDS